MSIKLILIQKYMYRLQFIPKPKFGTVDHLGSLLDTTVCSCGKTTMSIYTQNIVGQEELMRRNDFAFLS